MPHLKVDETQLQRYVQVFFTRRLIEKHQPVGVLYRCRDGIFPAVCWKKRLSCCLRSRLGCLYQILGVSFPQRFGRAPLPNWI